MFMHGMLLGLALRRNSFFLFLWLLVMLSTVSQLGAQLEAGEVVTVTVSANGYDPRIDEEKGCPPGGCTAENTRDGSLEDVSRWSCSLELVADAGGADGEECRIVYGFSDALVVSSISIALFNGDTRTRTMNIEVNGDQHSVITSGGMTSGFETFELSAEGVESIGLESVGLDDDEMDFLSIIEVEFNVVAIYSSDDDGSVTSEEGPAPETPAPETPTGTPEPPSEGSPAPAGDSTSASCEIGSLCEGELCCHPEKKTCGRKYTFCQERDLFNGRQCCAGTVGDPDELNQCAEDAICDAPEEQGLLERTEVWASIVGSIATVVGLFWGCRKKCRPQKTKRDGEQASP